MSTYYPHQKPKCSNVITHFGYFIVGAIIIFLLTTSILAYIKNTRLKKYVISINNEITNIQKVNMCLEKQIYSMLNDPIYRESIIRKELKMGKTGEIIIKKSP
jgi:cell division protein FtsB